MAGKVDFSRIQNLVFDTLFEIAQVGGTGRRLYSINSAPVSLAICMYSGSAVAEKELAAVRLGVHKLRGCKLKKIPAAGIATLTDEDFRPGFEHGRLL